MSTHFTCPRRADSAFMRDAVDQDYWEKDDTCSYCGSLNSDMVLARIEDGSLQVEPTDKNYKIYVTVLSGEKLKQTYRTDRSVSLDRSTWQWETREVDTAKFYFQHFSVEQQLKFVELVNAGKVKFSFPGHFYVRPYFIQYVDKTKEGAQ